MTSFPQVGPSEVVSGKEKLLSTATSKTHEDEPVSKKYDCNIMVAFVHVASRQVS